MKYLTMWFCLLFVSAPLAAQTFPDRNRRAVVDAANVIPDDQENALNIKIVQWNKSTNNQLVVATIPSLQGYDIKEYGYKLGRVWGLGHDSSAKGSTGAILLLAPTERKVRIEVGTGLEPVLTDAFTTQVRTDIITPKLKAGDIPSALSDGVDALIKEATPAPVEEVATPTKTTSSNNNLLWWVFGGVFVFFGALAVFAVCLIRKQKKEEQEAIAAARQAHILQEKRAAQLRGEDSSSSLVTPPRKSYHRSGSDPLLYPSRTTHDHRRDSGRTTITPVPVYSPPPPPPPSYSSSDDDDYRRSSSSSSSDFSWGGSDSSSSSSSDSGFDSGGGSFSGGGSDGSY